MVNWSVVVACDIEIAAYVAARIDITAIEIARVEVARVEVARISGNIAPDVTAVVAHSDEREQELTNHHRTT